MEQIFRQWIGMHRAMIAWFHAAHHVTKGTGFGGDHVNIYGRIYTELEEDFDEIVEKGLGLTGDETLADPVSILSMATGQLSQYPPPSNQDAEYIASSALEVAKAYIAFIEKIYVQFESSGMSLGLDDQLQGFANKYETYVYLLQQRTRGGNMKITESQLRRTIRKAISEYGRYNRRNQDRKRDWVIVCDWTKHPNPEKHRNGTSVWAEHFGTKAEAKYKAKQYAKEQGVHMWVEEGYEEG